MNIFTNHFTSRAVFEKKISQISRVLSQYTISPFWFSLFFITIIVVFPADFYAQCDTPTIDLPDASDDVVNPVNPYCTDLLIDPDITGDPFGISIDFDHTWQGDLSIRVIACGETLMVMTRPGGGSCLGGSPFGSSDDMMGTYTFSDGGGPDPDAGVAVNGGDYGISSDPCGAGTVNSFADLTAGCPPGPYTITICIADHAGSDIGTAANITPLTPVPAVCGCTNPDAPNYDPAANIDDGSCLCSINIDEIIPSQTCPGGSTGSVSITGSTSLDPITYSINGPGGLQSNMTGTFTDLAVGTYSVSIEGADPTCVTTSSFDITEAPPINVSISGGPSFCFGGSVDISAPAGYNSYSWSTSETSQTINVSAAGTYTVTVTDANNCSGTGSINISESANNPVTITPSGVLCDGENIDLDAGAGYSSYSWSTAETSQMITVGASGTYGVTVEDNNGCIYEGTADVSQNPALEPVITGDLDFCFGTNTDLTVEGGVFAAIQWSDMSAGTSITVNSPGTYSVTVSDSDGCNSETSVEVVENALPVPNISGVFSVCPVGVTSTTLDAGGGFTGYSWSSGGTSQLETVTGPGSISVTVTDNNGCEGEQTVTIDEFATTDPVITGDNTLCPAQETTIDAGDGFASYSWSTGDLTQQINISGIGTYEVTVVDNNGCETQGSFTTSPADVPEPEILGDANFCEGDFTTLTVNGVYDSYSWNGFGTPNTDGSQYTVAAPGVVMLDVTNEEGCVGSTFIEVLQIPLPNPTINGNSTICQGETGFIDAGGGYSMYLWNNGWDEQVLGVNDSGTYSVTVTDNYGCTGEASIEQSESLNVTISGALEICADNGSTVLDAGAGFNSYSWSDGSEGQQITVSEGGFLCRNGNEYDRLYGRGIRRGDRTGTSGCGDYRRPSGM